MELNRPKAHAINADMIRAPLLEAMDVDFSAGYGATIEEWCPFREFRASKGRYRGASAPNESLLGR